MNASPEGLVASSRRRCASISYGIFAAILSASLLVSTLPGAARAQVASPAPAAAAEAPPSRPSVADASQAMADGERDARADLNGGLWFVVGCLVGLVGVVLGYVVEPSPPPARLLGRSPEYVWNYTQAYRHEGKQAQGKRAMTGCAVGTAATAVIYLVLLASWSSSSTY